MGSSGGFVARTSGADRCLKILTLRLLINFFALSRLSTVALRYLRPSTLPYLHRLGKFYYESCYRLTRLSPCLATIPISSCVANRQALPLAGFATNAMGSAPSAIATCGRRPRFRYATNVVLATTRTSVWSAALKAYQMRSTASNAPGLRRTVMDVPRL